MPVLTRAAAKRLAEKDQEAGAAARALVLREPVTDKAGEVWVYRDNVDVYSGATKAVTAAPQVDHCLEVQLAEVALAHAFSEGAHSAHSMATAQAAELVRSALNDVANLNVTSAKINQAKRGPFTAALNRLQSDTLRSVSIEQLARQGRGKWMVDDGTWARIETAVVASYETAQTSLLEGEGGVDALPAAGELVEGCMSELQAILCALGFS